MHQTTNPWINGEGEPIAALRESLKGGVQTCVDQGPIFRAVSEAAPLDERLEQTWSAFMGRWDDLVCLLCVSLRSIGTTFAPGLKSSSSKTSI